MAWPLENPSLKMKKKTKQSLMALKNDGWSYFELVEYKENDVITLTHAIASGKISQRAFNPHKISLRGLESTGDFHHSVIFFCFIFHIR